MPLPQELLDFLNEHADTEGAPRPSANDDLFASGVLDSFSLVDFVALVEEHCGIKVPDNDVNPGNFQSIAAIERYSETHKD
jgi:acyl carrier protein